MRKTYHFLTAPNEELVGGRFCDVCRPLVPSKISVFAWHLLRNRIPTKSNMLCRRVLLQNDVQCVGGCECSETADHLFLNCDIFGSTMYFLWRWLDIDFVPAGVISEHFDQLAGMTRSSQLFFRIIWLTCV